MLKKEFFESFACLKRNFKPFFPFLMESVAIYLFLRLSALSFIYNFFASDGANSGIAFMLLNFFMLFLLVGFTEAAGLGSSFNGIKTNNASLWKNGNLFWRKMLVLLLLLLLAYLVAALPALVFLLLAYGPSLSSTAAIIFGICLTISMLIASFFLKFSRFIAIADAKKSAVYAIKKSIMIALENPKIVIMSISISSVMNIPAYFLSRHFIWLGIPLTALISRSWNANFFFMVYNRIKNGNSGKKHN